MRSSVTGIPPLNAGGTGQAGEPIPFDRRAVHPHAFRHAYAQSLADSGVAPSVLRDLMDHRSLTATLGYYRVGEARKRAAMELLARHTIDNRGTARPVNGPASHAGQLREELSWVAVPMGKCAEPANVRAGGGACPIRYQCAACPHFESDPSFLPELRGYADDLRREREAMLTAGAANWVVADVTRQLDVITSPSTPTKGRSAGCPANSEPRSRRPPPPCATSAAQSRSPSGPPPARPAVTDNSAALQRARRREGQTKRRQALAALQAMTKAGEAIGLPAVARRAGVSVSLLYADRDLLARIADARDRQRQAGAERAARLPARSLVTEASLRTDLANAKEQNRHLSEELAVLRDRLARELGADADHFPAGPPTLPSTCWRSGQPS